MTPRVYMLVMKELHDLLDTYGVPPNSSIVERVRMLGPRVQSIESEFSERVEFVRQDIDDIIGGLR